MSSRLLGTAAVAFALSVALALSLVLTLPVFAHSGDEASGISVEPNLVTAGGTVVLAGQGLEPNSERQINLVGPDVIVPFDAVTTDGEGMFSVTLTIPAHLPAETYTFQAIGDETLTTDCTITAAEGQAVKEPTNEAAAVVAPRDRSGVETAVLLLSVAITVILGLLLVWRAERFGRAAQP